MLSRRFTGSPVEIGRAKPWRPRNTIGTLDCGSRRQISILPYRTLTSVSLGSSIRGTSMHVVAEIITNPICMSPVDFERPDQSPHGCFIGREEALRPCCSTGSRPQPINQGHGGTGKSAFEATYRLLNIDNAGNPELSLSSGARLLPPSQYEGVYTANNTNAWSTEDPMRNTVSSDGLLNATGILIARYLKYYLSNGVILAELLGRDIEGRSRYEGWKDPVATAELNSLILNMRTERWMRCV
ncbi:hypothetical protein NXS19_004562 [Fusarium pseudograminearum]|nr:hypothetical protein NXS19_004562 [Fusarium pseudograminearum]